jgi:hypothetical protein
MAALSTIHDFTGRSLVKDNLLIRYVCVTTTLFDLGFFVFRTGEADSDKDVDESEIAANYAALNVYNGPQRKSNPDIPETIKEDD